MKRILHITGVLQNGGTENVVMNYYRHINRDKIQFDFVTYSMEKEYFNDEIEALGGRIFYVPSKKRPVKCFAGLFQLGKQYDIVHFHTASTLCWFELLALRLAGVKTIIAHSHYSKSPKANRNFLQAFCRPLLLALCDYYFACSMAAGKWLFGKDFAQAGILIPNAIDLNHFCFQREVREHLRKQYDIENTLILGHVGRFVPLKNHSLLIKILNELVKNGTDAKLMLIGDGTEMENVRALVCTCGLEDRVLFMGMRSDVNNLLQAMDAFILPSLHEGFPMALIEAQAAGLPCVYSDSISREIQVTGRAFPLSLTLPAEAWAREILRLWRDSFDRGTGIAECENAGFSIADNAKTLEVFYLASETQKGVFAWKR